MLSILEHFYLAENLDDALVALDKDGSLTVITKDGDLVSEYSARGGGTKQPSKLELSAERDRAGAELTVFDTQRVDLSSELEQAVEVSEKPRLLLKIHCLCPKGYHQKKLIESMPR